MLQGWKHTISCACGETTHMSKDLDKIAHLENTKATCCDSILEYRGFLPYHESIVKTPVRQSDVPRANVFSMIVEEPQTVVKEDCKLVKTEEIKAEIKIENSIINTTTNVPEIKNNNQMIVELRKAIDENNKNLIIILQDKYPKYYESSIKYLPKKYQTYIIENI